MIIGLVTFICSLPFTVMAPKRMVNILTDNLPSVLSHPASCLLHFPAKYFCAFGESDESIII